jgi:hypothetical protein
MVAFYYIKFNTENVLAAAGNFHRILRYAGNSVRSFCGKLLCMLSVKDIVTRPSIEAS